MWYYKAKVKDSKETFANQVGNVIRRFGEQL